MTNYKHLRGNLLVAYVVYTSTQKMEAVSSYESSVKICRAIRRHALGCEETKSNKFILIYFLILLKKVH
jgi:hypothetical protein